jgi:tetratricopeptide (TPR) repeat protein
MRGFSAVADLRRIQASGLEPAVLDIEPLLQLAAALRFDELATALGEALRSARGSGQLNSAHDTQLRTVLAFARKISGHWDKAESSYRKVANAPEFESAAWDRARALMGIAEIKSFRGDFEEALAIYGQAATLARETEARELLALCLIAMAGIHSRTGDQMTARQLLAEATEALGTEESPEHRFVRSHLFLSHGLFAFREGNLSSAEEYIQRALEHLSDEFPLERADALRYLAIFKSGRGQFNEALSLHQQALAIFKSLGFTFGMARTYNSIGRTFLALTFLEEAIFYMEKGVRICRELRAYAELATVYGKIGNAYMICEDYGRAIHYLQRDLELSNRFKNYYALGYTHRNLGRCYALGGNVEDGLQHLNESLALFQFVEDSANTGRVYLDLALASAERDLLEQAQEMGRKAIGLLETVSASECAYARLVLGAIERRLGHLDESEQLLKTAMQKLESGGKSSRLSEGYYEMGLLAMAREQRSEAFGLLEKSLRLAKELGLKKHAARCFSVLEKIGDLELLELLMRDINEPSEHLRGQLAPDLLEAIRVASPASMAAEEVARA